MKTNITNTPTIIILIILAALTLQACASPVQTVDANLIEGQLPEESIEILSIQSTNDSEIAADENTETLEIAINADEDMFGLTEAEIAGLIFMREEEKLAYDVYLALFDLWGLPLFQNIAQSEATHTEAVRRLLDKFEIPDPAEETSPGIFSNPDLQSLYDELTATGQRSLGDALKVGAAIEEIDILDLQENLLQTINPEIQRVYENLLKGSENHLRAFTSTLLRQTGETYQPQYLDGSAYKEILASTPAKGGRQNNNRRP